MSAVDQHTVTGQVTYLLPAAVQDVKFQKESRRFYPQRELAAPPGLAATL